MVSFNPVPEKQKYPSAQKKSRSPSPFHEDKKDNPGKNHRDTNAMQEFVPAGFVLVIVLRHVVRQARHKRTSCRPFLGRPRFGGRQPPWKENSIPKWVVLLERPERTGSHAPGRLLRRETRRALGKEENFVFSSARALEAINRGGLPWLLAW